MRGKVASACENLMLMARYESFPTTFSFLLEKTLALTGMKTRQDYLRGDYFDNKNGFDTSAVIESFDLDIPEDRKQTTTGYAPTTPHAFHHVMSMLDVDWRAYQFIDFGSGAGRVLILASFYPFRAIHGVELSPTLHDMANHNIQNHLKTRRPCQNIKSSCEDAINFHIPDDNLILYFYNPFEGKIFEKLIDNISTRQNKKKNKIYMLYCHPACEKIIKKNGCFKNIYDGFHGHNVWHIYESII